MPTTRVIKCLSDEQVASKLKDAVDVLRAGGLVVFPTETVYGLGANALDVSAVHKVYEVKGRPSDNPLIVHVSSLEDVNQFTSSIPPKGLRLAKKYWPGPLTLVLNRKNDIPDVVTAGLNTVAIRVPDHPVTIELLKQFNGGLVGPSANISGRPSPTTVNHVLQDLEGKVDIILDAGSTNIGVESTVVDVTTDPPHVLRLGGLLIEDIEAEIGEIKHATKENLLRRSPGTRHRHYAPHARVILVQSENSNELLKHLELLKTKNKKIGIISYSESLKVIEPSKYHIRMEPSIKSIAKNIFHALRELDKYEVEVILVESVSENGLGAAVMDRLRKASLQ